MLSVDKRPQEFLVRKNRDENLRGELDRQNILDSENQGAEWPAELDQYELGQRAGSGKTKRSELRVGGGVA